MDNRLIQSINREVYRRFPDVSGCAPRVQAYRPVKARPACPRSSQPRPAQPRYGTARPPAYLLVYQSRKTTSTGKALPYIVRVVADENGKIQKMTLSH